MMKSPQQTAHPKADGNALVRIIRFHEYGPSYIMSSLACSIVARFPLDVSVLPLLGYIGFSSMFGFVANDVADAQLDRKAGKTRNPVATGELSSAKAAVLMAMLLVASALSIYPLSSLNKSVGVAIIVLFATYSFGLRAKARPGFDIVYHSSAPALYGVMAYVLYHPIDFLGAGLSGMIFLLSLLTELVQEIRDYESDRAEIKTTVILVGKRNALKACIVILLSVLAIFMSMILAGALPLMLLVYSPTIALLIVPLLNTLNDTRREKDLIPVLRNRGTVIGLLILATYLALKSSRVG